jgi:hypothetical protein
MDARERVPFQDWWPKWRIEPRGSSVGHGEVRSALWQLLREADGLCRDSSPPRPLPNSEVARHGHDHSNDASEVEDAFRHSLASSHGRWFRKPTVDLKRRRAGATESTQSAWLAGGLSTAARWSAGSADPIAAAHGPAFAPIRRPPPFTLATFRRGPTTSEYRDRIIRRFDALRMG